MKNTLKLKISGLCFLIPAVLIFLGCPLLQGPIMDGTAIDYYSKIIEYSAYVDPYGYSLEPVETRLFDEQGKLSGIFRYYYEPFEEGSDDWVLIKTAVYDVSSVGDESLSNYYIYEYIKDTYTVFDEEDNPYEVTEYLLSKGESYTAKNFLYHYYDVVYTAAFDYEPERYLSIRDYEWDEDLEVFKEAARQVSTYAVVYRTEINGTDVAYWDFVTEKYFDTPSGEDEMSLSQEFACWYDEEGLWTHELYHTVRSSTGTKNVYYYTKFDWNDAYQVYRQQDFNYDPASIPTLSAQPEAFLNGTYNIYQTSTDPDPLQLNYNLQFNAVGALEEALTLTYDDLGNVVLKVMDSNGSEHERIVYRYNSNSEELSMARYIQGTSYPYDRVETRYRDEYREGVYYRVREELTYKSYESDNTRSFRAAPSKGNLFEDFSKQVYRPIRSNHER